MNEPARLHALDNLRAVMMWLGIVLHVAIIYTTAPNAFPFHDRHTTVGADLLLLFIHASRMPVFFILAGFFAALLTQRDGPGGMLRNRLRRIGLPFAIFWPLLFAATVLAFMLFVHVMQRGAFGIDPALMARPDGSKAVVSTIHLWFLYYLLIFCGIAAAIVHLGRQRPTLHDAAAARITPIAGAWWGPLMLALIAACVGFGHPAGIAPNRTSFFPYPDELIYNGMFFAFGWQLYRNKAVLLGHYSARCWRYLGTGALLFVLYLGLIAYDRTQGPQSPLAARFGMAFIYGCLNWLLSFGLIGLFTRYLPRPGPLLAYLARSSYWVYLLHFPLTVAIGAVLYRVDAGAPLKMLVNVSATTAICLLTYHLLVRPTRIGGLLNGPQKSRPAAASSAQLDNKPVLH